MLKRTLWGLVAAVALTTAAPAGAVAVNTASSSAILLADASATKPTRILAYAFASGGLTTVKLEYGTQTTTPCDTATTALTGPMSIPATGYIAAGNGVDAVLRAPPGYQVCIVQTATSQLSGFVTVAQP